MATSGCIPACLQMLSDAQRVCTCTCDVDFSSSRRPVELDGLRVLRDPAVHPHAPEDAKQQPNKPGSPLKGSQRLSRKTGRGPDRLLWEAEPLSGIRSDLALWGIQFVADHAAIAQAVREHGVKGASCIADAAEAAPVGRRIAGRVEEASVASESPFVATRISPQSGGEVAPALFQA